MTGDEYLCFVCFHVPSVHGVTRANLGPCDCCESPAAIEAARAAEAGGLW